jgi:hypothetical protein
MVVVVGPHAQVAADFHIAGDNLAVGVSLLTEVLNNGIVRTHPDTTGLRMTVFGGDGRVAASEQFF